MLFHVYNPLVSTKSIKLSLEIHCLKYVIACEMNREPPQFSSKLKIAFKYPPIKNIYVGLVL